MRSRCCSPAALAQLSGPLSRGQGAKPSHCMWLIVPKAGGPAEDRIHSPSREHPHPRKGEGWAGVTQSSPAPTLHRLPLPSSLFGHPPGCPLPFLTWSGGPLAARSDLSQASYPAPPHSCPRVSSPDQPKHGWGVQRGGPSIPQSGQVSNQQASSAYQPKTTLERDASAQFSIFNWCELEEKHKH